MPWPSQWVEEPSGKGPAQVGLPQSVGERRVTLVVWGPHRTPASLLARHTSESCLRSRMCRTALHSLGASSPLATMPFHTLTEHLVLDTQLRFSMESPARKLLQETWEPLSRVLGFAGRPQSALRELRSSNDPIFARLTSQQETRHCPKLVLWPGDPNHPPALGMHTA